MLCQNCKKNTATVHYRENVNGRVTEYSLCQECAAELERQGKIGMSHPFDMMLDDDNSLGSLFSAMLQSHHIREEKRCPVCSSGYRELAATGKVGCPKCYEIFAEELAPTINQLHGSAKSMGRAPKRFGEKREREQLLTSLKAELKAAIDTQDFEKACELRDRIKSIEAEN